MTLSIRRSRRRKMSSIAGFTSHAMSPPAPETTRASSALAVTACQCGFSERSRRPRTRYRWLTGGRDAVRGDESSSTPFEATLAKPVRLFKLRGWPRRPRGTLPQPRALSMCGIAGVLMRRGRPDEGELRRMGDALAHRGPDDLGVHVAGPLGLLQTRLSIIALEGGHQPMADGPLTLVANGEIYNFVELRQALEARGRRFRTRSDTGTRVRRRGRTPVAQRHVRLRAVRRCAPRAGAGAGPPGHQAALLRGAAGPGGLRLRAEGDPRRLPRRAGARPRRAHAVSAEPLQHRRAEPRARHSPAATGRDAGGGRRPA